MFKGIVVGEAWRQELSDSGGESLLTRGLIEEANSGQEVGPGNKS